MGKHSKPSDIDISSYSKRRHRGGSFTDFLLKPAVMISVTAVLVLAMLGGTFFVSFNYNYNSDFGDYDDSDLGITANLDEAVTNIALFGIDSRSTTAFSGNSDSIMIISLDSTDHTIKLTSIMRDTLIEIPGYSPSKINSAYAKGGPKLAIKTINQNFGLNIKDYCTVNFTGMEHIIDAVGGIEATLTKAEVKDANKHLQWQALAEGKEPDYIEKEGTQILSGIQAVSYARIRYAKNPNGNTDDYGRTDRQRYVMEQLFNKALELKKGKYPALIKAMLPFIETSLSYEEILNLAAFLGKDVQFLQARIPSQEYVINGGFKIKSGASTVYYNIDYAKDVLHGFLYENIDPDAYIKLHKPDKTPWYQLDVSSSTVTSRDNDTSSENDTSSDNDVSSSDISSNTNSSDVSSSDVSSNTSSDTTSSDVSSNDSSSSDTVSGDNDNDNDNDNDTSSEPVTTTSKPSGDDDEGENNTNQNNKNRRR
ncbi:MAG: LCP family protein [Clostridia bacterium]|nr:LCP family protein [Clostridia bacterium]